MELAKTSNMEEILGWLGVGGRERMKSREEGWETGETGVCAGLQVFDERRWRREGSGKCEEQVRRKDLGRRCKGLVEVGHGQRG